jgi:DNA polymerase-4
VTPSPTRTPAAGRLRVIHVDMDAFYAAVEVHDDPALAGRPLIVGGTGRRAVVAACSYEARVYGVHSAMPSAQARRLCPQAIFVAGRYARYQEVSQALRAVFERFTPLIEPIALDEAFLDVGGALRLFGPAPALATRIRTEVAEDLGLTCSVGVATNKFLAKLASEAAKPNVTAAGPTPGAGVVVVEPGQELAFLHPLAIEALWGVGPATSARLRRLGVGTVGQLSQVPIEALQSAVGRAAGEHLHRLSLGIDERSVEPTRVAKSVGHEETWADDRFDPDELRLQVLRMADAVSSRLRRSGVAGRTVTLKVRYGDFTTMTRSLTSTRPLDTALQLSRVGAELLGRVDITPGVRLLGLSVSGLAPAGGAAVEDPDSGQLRFALDEPEPRSPASAAGAVGHRQASAAGWSAAADAIDAVRHRFGERAVGPAALVGHDGLSLKRQGDTQWGPSATEEGQE